MQLGAAVGTACASPQRIRIASHTTRQLSVIEDNLKNKTRHGNHK